MPEDDNTPKNTESNSKAKTAILVAVIAGLFGIAGSAFQFWLERPVTQSAVDEELSRRLPIGTIVQSVLPPEKFVVAAGDKPGFGTTESFWVPADGRSVSGSGYAKLHTSKVPDLRGVFIRGLNTSEANEVRTDSFKDPDGDGRVAGSLQSDQLQSHKHIDSGHSHATNAVTTAASNTGDDARDRNYSTPPRGASVSKGYAVLGDPVQSSGGTVRHGSETRPKNIAVYFYIKIN